MEVVKFYISHKLPGEVNTVGSWTRLKYHTSRGQRPCRRDYQLSRQPGVAEDVIFILSVAAAPAALG